MDPTAAPRSQNAEPAALGGRTLVLRRHGAVLFDMDGTLVDTETAWFEAGLELLDGMDTQLPPDAYQQMHGLDLDAAVRWLQAHGARIERDEYVRRLLAAVATRLPAAPAREGAAGWVTAVARARLPRAVVSNSPRGIVEATLAPHAWARHLDVRVTVDDVGSPKPAPDAYLLAARRLGVAAPECLVLEDSRVGARAAVAAGATCVLVTFGGIDPDEARAITPLVARDLLEAWSMVAGLGRG